MVEKATDSGRGDKNVHRSSSCQSGLYARLWCWRQVSPWGGKGEGDFSFLRTQVRSKWMLTRCQSSSPIAWWQCILTPPHPPPPSLPLSAGLTFVCNTLHQPPLSKKRGFPPALHKKRERLRIYKAVFMCLRMLMADKPPLLLLLECHVSLTTTGGGILPSSHAQ